MDRKRGVAIERGIAGFTAAILVVSLAGLGGLETIDAAPKALHIGIILQFTGSEAETNTLQKDGMVLAIEEANAAGGAGGYRIEPIMLDEATATAGQCDPAQAATDIRKLVGTPDVVVNLGPGCSGSGKAMSRILSEADMATITASTTNPDITSPKFASQFRPNGKTVYFRTCTTDAYTGPGEANFFAEKLRIKSVFVLDDSGAYGVGLADTFEKRAKEKGLNVLGRDQLNPKEADYTTILTKIKGLNPDALYYGGDEQAGVKLAKQGYDVIPNAVKGGGGGVYSSDFLKAGFPAAAGWYATAAVPHLPGIPDAQPWLSRFVARWGKQPNDYTLTGYDAALVALDAIKRVARSGKPVNRHAVRDAIQATRLGTVQGLISFDANGDLVNKTVSLYQIIHNPKFADDDVIHQYKYIGVAPQN
jgi:branched-chain amino acid transport system substrate-binding protein